MRVRQGGLGRRMRSWRERGGNTTPHAVVALPLVRLTALFAVFVVLAACTSGNKQSTSSSRVGLSTIPLLDLNVAGVATTPLVAVDEQSANLSCGASTANVLVAATSSTRAASNANYSGQLRIADRDVTITIYAIGSFRGNAARYDATTDTFAL